MLSGHTHGGQIHLFGFRPYERGRLKRENDLTILISNGYGTTGVPLRLGAKAETHLINNSERDSNLAINHEKSNNHVAARMRRLTNRSFFHTLNQEFVHCRGHHHALRTFKL